MSDEEYTALVEQIFAAKWVVNGFPKSGTHLLVQLLAPLAPYQPGEPDGKFKRPWSGTFLDNSWTNRWCPIEQTCYKLSRVDPGHLLKAHLGYIPELERWMYLSGIIHVFIYRDLRDVAVSQAYHILNADKTTLAHPEPDRYTELGGFDEVLAAVISGIGPYPGVVSRWEHYVGWLQAQWVYTIRFENVLADPKRAADTIFRHAMKRQGAMFGRNVTFEPHGLDVMTEVMAAATKQTDKSPTFRKGNVGDWREEFTPHHVDLWRKHDHDKWLVRLNYEKAEWYGARSPIHQGTENAAEPGPTLFEKAATMGAPRRAGGSGSDAEVPAAVERDNEDNQAQAPRET